jgi:hypothetical protein
MRPAGQGFEHASFKIWTMNMKHVTTSQTAAFKTQNFTELLREIFVCSLIYKRQTNINIILHILISIIPVSLARVRNKIPTTNKCWKKKYREFHKSEFCTRHAHLERDKYGEMFEETEGPYSLQLQDTPKWSIPFTETVEQDGNVLCRTFWKHSPSKVETWAWQDAQVKNYNSACLYYELDKNRRWLSSRLLRRDFARWSSWWWR